jgi:hypothetical protein
MAEIVARAHLRTPCRRGILLRMIRPQSPLLRAIASIQALLFLAVQLAEGSGLHHCPMHDGVPGAPAETAHHHHASSGHDDGTAPTHQQHTLCICLGTCHAGALSVVPSAPRIAPAASSSVVPGIAAAPRPATSPSHLLPFALGPPLSA